jgi:hypothetical protein
MDNALGEFFPVSLQDVQEFGGGPSEHILTQHNAQVRNCLKSLIEESPNNLIL